MFVTLLYHTPHLSSKALIMNYGDLPINYITEYSYLSLHLNKFFARIAQDFKNLTPKLQTNCEMVT